MITLEQLEQDLKNVDAHLGRTDGNIIEVEKRLNKRIDSLKETIERGAEAYRDLEKRISSAGLTHEEAERIREGNAKAIEEIRVDIGLIDGDLRKEMKNLAPKKTPWAAFSFLRRK